MVAGGFGVVVAVGVVGGFNNMNNKLELYRLYRLTIAYVRNYIISHRFGADRRYQELIKDYRKD